MQIANQTVKFHRYNTVILGAGAAGMNCAVHLYEFMKQKGIADPQEQIDLYDESAFAGIKGRLLEGLLCWYASSGDLRGLKDRISGGGPIARRANEIMGRAGGLESEEALGAVADEIDRMSPAG